MTRTIWKYRSTNFQIEPQLDHGLNRGWVTARREPRPTGRAKLLLSPIFGPLPLSVFNPCFIRGSIPYIFGWLSLRRISQLLRLNFRSGVDSGIGGFDGKIRLFTCGYYFLNRPCWPLIYRNFPLLF